MQFENTFAIAAPVGDVYATLLDVERVVPCMPGAEILERSSDDDYRVGVKVKLGPMTMTYRGDVHVVERDPSSHTATMQVSAKEARGQGTATAAVTMRLNEQDGGTRGTIDADVRLSGKAAAMGQGVIADVSGRLVDQFADNLAAMLSGPPAEAAAAASNGGAPVSAPPKADEGVDVLSLAAGVAAERTRDPRVTLVAVVVALALGYLLGRRS